MLYFFLKHCMNKLSGLSVPKSRPPSFVFIVAADNAASKLTVASFNSCRNLAISLSFVRNFSAKSCYVSRRFCNLCHLYNVYYQKIMGKRTILYIPVLYNGNLPYRYIVFIKCQVHKICLCHVLSLKF